MWKTAQQKGCGSSLRNWFRISDEIAVEFFKMFFCASQAECDRVPLYWREGRRWMDDVTIGERKDVFSGELSLF